VATVRCEQKKAAAGGSWGADSAGGPEAYDPNSLSNSSVKQLLASVQFAQRGMVRSIAIKSSVLSRMYC
jgi:hypothetical protein